MFGHVVLRERTNSLLLEIIERKKWNCTWKDRIAEPLFRVLNNRGLVRGFLMSLYRSIANIPFRSFWLGANVTLQLFLFLGKFLANRLSWNKCMFFLLWMMGVSHKHFIDKFINEWKYINWLNKINITTFKGRFGSQLFRTFFPNWWWNVFEWAIVKALLVLKCLLSNQFLKTRKCLAVGPNAGLFTWQIHCTIQAQSGWDCSFPNSVPLLEGLRFWFLNIETFNGYGIRPKFSPGAVIFCDASDYSYGSF